MYDVVIIGCGVVGASAAYELARYKLRVAVLEAAASVVWLVLFVLLFAGGNLRFAPAAARALKG